MNLEIDTQCFIQMACIPHHNVNIVIFKNCGDIHPFSPAPSFPNAKVVVFDLCDKNFTYYWCTPEHFPKARVYYILSHPANYGLHHRFNNTHDIYVPVRYYHEYYDDAFRRRIPCETRNKGNVIRLIDNFDYRQCLNIKSVTNDINATDPRLYPRLFRLKYLVVLLVILLVMITRHMVV